MPGSNSTIPGRFEDLVASDPFAPAVVLARPGHRDRVWNRAAIEHRAIQIAALCAELELSADAVVDVQTEDLVDAMAAAWFVLATGRALGTGPEAQLLDAAALSNGRRAGGTWRPASLAQPDGVALSIPGRSVRHAQLPAALGAEPPEGVSATVWAVLRALDSGAPITIAEDGRLEAQSSSAA